MCHSLPYCRWHEGLISLNVAACQISEQNKTVRNTTYSFMVKHTLQCEGRYSFSIGRLMFPPSDGRVPSCSDEVCVCLQIHTAGLEDQTLVDCVCLSVGEWQVHPDIHSAALSCVLVIQQHRKKMDMRWMQTLVQFWEGEWWGGGVTQRMVGTSRGQQNPRCCSWLFPGWDLQPWVTCPADTKGGSYMRTLTSSQQLALLQKCVLPGRLLSDWGWGVYAVPRLAGSDAGSATGTRPHWDDPGTGLQSDCSPLTHLETHKTNLVL